MQKKWILGLIVAVTLIFSQQARAAMEMEAGEGDSKIHIHGYGELHYNVPEGDNSKMDLHRMVWGISYDFNDQISLHTEVDFEHAAQEMELEFAYIDFAVDPAVNMRAGLMLMPVGPLNEFHEPTNFYGVERPAVQKVIIPTTWQEGGFGVFGSPMEGLRYRLYIVSGLAGEGFRAKDGIRKGRGKGDGGEHNKQTGEELAVVARVEYSPLVGLDFGASFYEGGVDQATNIMGDPSVNIVELDARLRMAGVDFQALYAKVDIDDADKINAIDPANPGDVAEELLGWYLELAYHLGHQMGMKWDVVPFVRIETANTQESMPTGTTATLKYNRDITTYGFAVYPHDQIALKVDLQSEEDEDPTTPDKDQFNLGIAWVF